MLQNTTSHKSKRAMSTGYDISKKHALFCSKQKSKTIYSYCTAIWKDWYVFQAQPEAD